MDPSPSHTLACCNSSGFLWTQLHHPRVHPSLNKGRHNVNTLTCSSRMMCPLQTPPGKFRSRHACPGQSLPAHRQSHNRAAHDKYSRPCEGSQYNNPPHLLAELQQPYPLGPHVHRKHCMHKWLVHETTIYSPLITLGPGLAFLAREPTHATIHHICQI